MKQPNKRFNITQTDRHNVTFYAYVMPVSTVCEGADDHLTLTLTLTATNHAQQNMTGSVPIGLDKLVTYLRHRRVQAAQVVLGVAALAADTFGVPRAHGLGAAAGVAAVAERERVVPAKYHLEEQPLEHDRQLLRTLCVRV